MAAHCWRIRLFTEVFIPNYKSSYRTLCGLPVHRVDYSGADLQNEPMKNKVPISENAFSTQEKTIRPFDAPSQTP